MPLRIHTAALCALALCLAGCAGDGPSAVDSDSWFARLQRDVFDQNCTTAGCHNPQAAAAGLILTEGQSFDSLVGVQPTNAAAIAAGLVRVEPFDIDTSFLLTKVTNPGPGQGSRMPQGAEPLTEEQISTIREWIEAGAPQFDTPPPGEATSTPTPTSVPDTATATAAPDTPTATAAPNTPTTTVAPTTETPVSTPTAGDSTPTEPIPTATPTTEPTVTLEQLQEQIFTPSCATQFCHSGEFPAGGLSLEDGDSFDQMVDVEPANFAAQQAGLLRVDPGDAENSFLLTKVVGPDSIELGSRMPFGEDPLPEEQIDMIRRWIESL